MKTPKAEQVELPFLTETKPPLFKEMEEVQVSVGTNWLNAHIVMAFFPGDDSRWIVRHSSGRITMVTAEHIRRIER